MQGHEAPSFAFSCLEICCKSRGSGVGLASTDLESGAAPGRFARQPEHRACAHHLERDLIAAFRAQIADNHGLSSAPAAAATAQPPGLLAKTDEGYCAAILRAELFLPIPTIVVSVAKPGHLQQCLAFCDRMGWPVTEQLMIPGPRRMKVWWRSAWLRFRRRVVEKRVMPLARTAGRLRIVASGTASETTAGAYRKLYGKGLYAVCIGTPRTKAPIFDLAVSSHHALTPGQTPTPSHYRGARKTFWMPGVLVKPLPCNDEASRPHVTVALIGGKNKAFDFAESALLPRLSAIAGDRDTTLVVVFSRRTPRSLEKRIRAVVAGARTTFIDRHDRPGFLKAAANAHNFVVTPDSITMTSEAYVTGKPVSLFDLPCFDHDTTTYRFYSELRAMPADRVGEILRQASDTVIGLAQADFAAWLGDRPEAP